MGMHNLRAKIKSVLGYMIYHSGLFSTWLNRLNKDRFLVLMYHRIVPAGKAGPYLQPGMYVEPETFDLHLHFLKQHFDIRTVEELCDPAAKEQRKNLRRIACYLTFDDGWSDFYHYAFPLLVKHHVPVTVYLPTGFIGTSKTFWTDRLGGILTMVNHKKCFAEFREYVRTELALENHGLSSTPEQFFEEIIYELKKLREERISALLVALEYRYAVPTSAIKHDFLTWNQVEEMHRSGLVTYGSHTVNHHILTTLKAEEIHKELHYSKQCLNNKGLIKNDKVSFCYPNGNYNDDVMRVLLSEKYTCAFTTLNGWNKQDNHFFELKRVGLHQDISSNKHLLAYNIYRSNRT